MAPLAAETEVRETRSLAVLALLDRSHQELVACGHELVNGNSQVMLDSVCGDCDFGRNCAGSRPRLGRRALQIQVGAGVGLQRARQLCTLA